jgi:hypothetical protein
MKLYETSNNEYTIKLGETDDIAQRVSTIRQEYKTSPIILDIFPCQRPHKFEQFLLNCPIIKKNRIDQTELIKISSDFTYNDIVDKIKQNIDFFNTNDNNMSYETQKSKELTVLLQTIQICDDEELKELLVKRFKQLLGEQKAEATEERQTPVVSSRRVYQYKPTYLKRPIAVYNSLREAARSLDDVKIHDYHIREACENATIFRNYRWFCVDGDDNIPESIPENSVPVTTTTVKPHRQGLVAQICPNKEKIIKVYSSQKIAAEDIRVSPSSMTTSITVHKKCGGFYWKMYEECSNELKLTFEGIIPSIEKPATCSKAIHCIDPHTNEIIQTYDCIQDICSKFKTCHKSIHKACQSGNIFKNCVWNYA